MPSTSPSTTSSPTWCGTSQHSVVGAELARPPVRHAGRHARPLGVELVARSPSPIRIDATALGVGDREPLELALRLARLEQRPERASGQIVGDVLALEHSHHDRVRAGVERTLRCVASTCTGANIPVPSRIGLRTATEPLERETTMPKTVILSAARTPIGKLGGGLSSVDATELGGTAIQARARARRRRARPDPARRDGPGAPGRPGPDPLAPGADQGRDPQGDLLGDDQQGVRVGDPRRPACSTTRSASATSRSASAAGWSRCRSPPTCSRRRASASGWATARRSTR